MRRTDVIVIGGGQAGLAMSRCLAGQGIAHVVLERGRVAERWRTGSWDSLRLLTPNWMNNLPHWAYDGDDRHGFMPAGELIDRLDRYAASFAAPIETRTEVLAVARRADGYRVLTSAGEWQARAVVVATGHCQQAALPPWASELPRHIRQVVPADYRRPEDLAEGPVLVIGASASGLQIAEEINRAGRPVTLSAGRHTRMPRRYRGRDIFAWMQLAGVLDDRAEATPDLKRARRQPSLQLVGRADGAPLDLGVLQARGVAVAGRAVAVAGGAVRFADDLSSTTMAADRRMARLLERIDAFIARTSLSEGAGAPDPPPSAVTGRSPASLPLAAIRTVIWATGYRRDYSWLKVPVLAADGEIAHRGGVTPAPGLYVLGLPFLRRRKSNFIGGVGDDARELTAHLAAYLGRQGHMAA
jgi:putative flavoprotein involved in K+ transport